MLQQDPRPRSAFFAAALLLLVLAAELVFSVHQNSQTFDESAHIYAGYSYWKTHDFGINPEHPPLAKLVAALPLLPLKVAVNLPPPTYFRGASARGGRQFLYSHNADSLLFRSRMSISVFTFALALLVFFAAREMFDAATALIALAVLVFEPNILAHGALVTTDMAETAMMFGTVYTFYRYLKQPSFTRLLVCSLFAGLALSVKHSGLLIFPILLVLVAVYLVLASRAQSETPRTFERQGAFALGSLVFIAAVSVIVLWSCYGFRYAARPGNAQITPPTAAFLKTLDRPAEARFIGFSERHHLLPEAYLYGLTDILVLTNQGRYTYLFGKDYPEGQWFYFPSTIVIKSTIAFLLLLALALATRYLWQRNRLFESLFLLIPAAVYLGFAMRSKLDLGLRHILPIYPFLIVLMAAGAWALIRRSRNWVIAIAALLLFHAASSLRAYPDYLAYSNEFWGGPSKTYQVSGDANVGWSSGLHTLQHYISDRHITQCWFAYYGTADLSYFHLPCKPLPTYFSILLGNPQSGVPETIQGPVFVASENIPAGFWGPSELNPYAEFRRSDTVLAGEILVFNGTFNVRTISGLSHYVLANKALRAGQPDRALPEAQQAAALAPDLLVVHEMLAALYAGLHKPEDAEREYRTAVDIYQTKCGSFAKHMSPPENPLGQPPATLAANK